MGMLKYIELKSGYGDSGPAWIGRVKTSKSGRTIYFDGKALKRAMRGAGRGAGSGNHTDLETGEIYWVSGVKKRGTNRHWAGGGKILVERAVMEELLRILGEPALDPARFAVTDEIRETDPKAFTELENRPE